MLGQLGPLVHKDPKARLVLLDLLVQRVTLVTLDLLAQLDLKVRLDLLVLLEQQAQLDQLAQLVQLDLKALLELMQPSRRQWTTRLPITPWSVEMPSS
jgi:hypothetical protein